LVKSRWNKYTKKLTLKGKFKTIFQNHVYVKKMQTWV